MRSNLFAFGLFLAAAAEVALLVSDYRVLVGEAIGNSGRAAPLSIARRSGTVLRP